ncbi:hypothetical protein [Alkalihalophilus marmarensis]|uniref:hypothetical protein n=1 Tax=Alkalihalophilus marmarensis TaxID=521377 RepID=UPI002DBB2BEC|nr:hypothetical protein [Alkalihalophilus marmarensis]MEC2073405.1 hypothetical protein [Alkalihalophilus marmarensis]
MLDLKQVRINVKPLFVILTIKIIILVVFMVITVKKFFEGVYIATQIDLTLIPIALFLLLISTKLSKLTREEQGLFNKIILFLRIAILFIVIGMLPIIFLLPVDVIYRDGNLIELFIDIYILFGFLISTIYTVIDIVKGYLYVVREKGLF